MINILLAGVGGQGTVLAAKVLAQAAQNNGWKVRTAETIGMAQRGGSVVSHVRMGNEGELVHAPLLALQSADVVIAFEPAEAARVLPYLKPHGLVVTAQTAVQPVTAALSKEPYRASDVIARLQEQVERLVVVDDEALTQQVGSRKALNTILLAKAVQAADLGISLEDLCAAIEVCVKERFVPLNLKAIEVAVA